MDAISSNTLGQFRAILTIAAAGFVVIVFILRNFKKPKEAVSPLPPGPSGLPVVGYLPFLGTQLHKQFTELVTHYGHIFKLSLGAKLYVVVSSPSLIKEIVRVHDVTFANRDPNIASKTITYGGNNIVFTPYGPEWIKLRKVFVRELMSNSNLDACYPMRKQEVHKALRHVCGKIGEAINVGELMFLTNINVIMRIVFGSALEGDEGTKAGLEFMNLVAELMELMGAPNISDIFPQLSRFDLQGVKRKVEKIRKGFEAFINYATDRCLNSESENGKRGNCLFHLLMELVDHHDASKSISDIQLRTVVTDIIIGGSDTTSTMLEWIMTELLNHQEIMEKVHEELNKVVGLNQMVEEQHLPQLHYLDAAVKETFRLHPAVPFLIPRCPSKSCVVGGYTIPKGATIFLNVYAMQRDPQLWTDPLEFKPERFLNEGSTSKFDFSGNDFRYIPFGSGRRICAGLPLAEKTLMYQLASLLHAFKWELPNGVNKVDMTDSFGIVTKKLEPLFAVPHLKLRNLRLHLD